MRWILAAVIAVAVVEIFVRLPIGSWLARLLATGRRVAHVVQSSRISDHWKQKVLLAYAGRIFGLTLLLGLAILLSAAAVLVLVAAVARTLDASFMTFMMSPAALVFTTVAALAYLWIRRRLTWIRRRLAAS